MSSNNHTENKLRTFKLIDREGFISRHDGNNAILNYYLKDGCISGFISEQCHLYEGPDMSVALISKVEFKYFQEITGDTFEEKPTTFKADRVTIGGYDIKDILEGNISGMIIPSDHKEPLLPDSQKFSQSPISPITIISDCKALGTQLCFTEDGCALYHEEETYHIKSEEDYKSVINSLKVLQSFKK